MESVLGFLRNGLVRLLSDWLVWFLSWLGSGLVLVFVTVILVLVAVVLVLVFVALILVLVLVALVRVLVLAAVLVLVLSGSAVLGAAFAAKSINVKGLAFLACPGPRLGIDTVAIGVLHLDAVDLARGVTVATLAIAAAFDLVVL